MHIYKCSCKSNTFPLYLGVFEFKEIDIVHFNYRYSNYLCTFVVQPLAQLCVSATQSVMETVFVWLSLLLQGSQKLRKYSSKPDVFAKC